MPCLRVRWLWLWLAQFSFGWNVRGWGGLLALSLCDECADFGEVVVEDGMPGPCSSAVDAVEAGAVQSVVAFDAVDAAFAAGSPADHAPERAPLLDAAPFGVGAAFAG